MTIIIIAALCYLISLLQFEGALIFKQLVINILAILGILFFILCIFGVHMKLPGCFGAI